MTAPRSSARALRAALPGVPTCPGCEMPWEEGHACAAAPEPGSGAWGKRPDDELVAALEAWDPAGALPAAAPLREALIAASVAAGGVDAVPGTRFTEDELIALGFAVWSKALGCCILTEDGVRAFASGSVALTKAERTEVAKRLAKGKV